MKSGITAPLSAPARSATVTADALLLSAYDWESDRERITLGDATQRFRDVNGYVGLPIPAKPAFIKVFRLLINGRRPPELIYRMHDASHVLTGSTFTHSEPPLVLLASEAVEQGLYFGSRGAPKTGGLDPVLRRGIRGVRPAHRVLPSGLSGYQAGRLQSGLRLRTTHPSHQPLHPSHRRAVGCPGGRRPPAAGDAGRRPGRGALPGDRGAAGSGRSSSAGVAGVRHLPITSHCPHTGRCAMVITAFALSSD